jgi:hypothetical protein
MNDREVTASFLQALAAKVIDGVYDVAEEQMGKDAKKDTASDCTP